MTAEIAILNKSAVALAADSAVTISVGRQNEKTYDTADKLFELSTTDPIGIMVNDNLQFAEIPLQVIIKEYRSENRRFARVQEAGKDFLRYLSAKASESPQEVRVRSVLSQCTPLLVALDERVWDSLKDSSRKREGEAFDETQARIAEEEIEALKRAWEGPSDAIFLDDQICELNQPDLDAISLAVKALFVAGNAVLQDRLTQLLVENVQKHWFDQPATGIVVAGFGGDDKFPTLVEYEVFGMIGGALKLRERMTVDIARNGDRARVVPFAQREMVERFLYGLDSNIADKIRQFCASTAPQIANKLLSLLDIDDDVSVKLFGEAIVAENEFLSALQQHLLGSIGADSRAEIESMVEFMPKPELSRLAEELVNLTSIKRRASTGMPTVGGPIDVAVISKAEGFVWVKRKHYFPAELNARYFDRIRHRPLVQKVPKDD